MNQAGDSHLLYRHCIWGKGGGGGGRTKSLQINFHDCLKMKKKINKELGIFWNQNFVTCNYLEKKGK